MTKLGESDTLPYIKKRPRRGHQLTYSLNKDTLAYHMARPGVSFLSHKNVPLPEIVKGYKNFTLNPGKYVFGKYSNVTHGANVLEQPEHEALRFYMLNHAYALIGRKVHPLISLGDFYPIVDKYHEVLELSSLRMFFYMLMICTRESRHVKNVVASPLFKELTHKYGLGIVNFHTYRLRDKSSEGAVSALTETPPSVSLGPYVSFLADVFRQGDFSSGYGGKAWANVADVLVSFVHGKSSAEMMLDTAFTLCHNGGPIFNKGLLFKMYTDNIYKILDVQNAGMIPQYVGSPEYHYSEVPSDIKTYHKELLELLPEFRGKPDWYVVSKMAKEGKKKKHDTDYLKEKLLQDNLVKVKPASHSSGNKTELLKEVIQLYPGGYYKKVKAARW